MIISHRYRYLFVEIPLTASWAIRRELCTYYEGTSILHKHASYPEFLRTRSAEERDYFGFATVRNPLDVAVSRYCKLKADHKGAFTDPQSIKALRADLADVRKYDFVHKSDADFAAYFARYHRYPYFSVIELSEKHLDFVIRYEHLQEDFSTVLDRLGVEQVRSVPVANRTQGKRADWQSYYTDDIVEQAKRRFGPFMSKWGYQFPPEWGECAPHLGDRMESWLFSTAQRVYALHFRYSERPIGRTIRWLRAVLTK